MSITYIVYHREELSNLSGGPMNTNYLLFLYANQKSFDIPSKVQSSLREKIKESDFLIADETGTHRLVGLKFYSKSKETPVITCICMRHEMTAAKQIAFELGKKIYYDTKASARLFKYRVGTHVQKKDYEPVLKLYAKYYAPKRHKNIVIKSNGQIYINNHLLPPYFKLSFLVELLGEPNAKGCHEDYATKAKFYRWFDYGLEAGSYPGHKGYVGYMTINAKETIENPMHASIDIFLGKDKIEDAAPFERYLKYGRHCISIKNLNKDQCIDCGKGEIAMLQISFGPYPSKFIFAICKNDKEKVMSLIKQGSNVNSKTGPYFQTPLMFAAIRNKFEIAKVLLQNGANPDIQDIYGRTARQVIMEKLNKNC